MKKMLVSPIPGVTNLWQLLWVGMAIVIVWLGAQAAFKMDTLFEKFASPIMNAGASIGRLLVKLPLLAPLPLPGATGPWKDLNVGQALNIAKAPDQLLAPKFYLPPLVGGGGGPRAVGGDNAARLLESRLKLDSTAEQQKLAQINQTLQRLQNTNAADQATQKQLTTELRTHLNAVLNSGDDKAQFTGSSAEMKDVINKLRTQLAPQGKTVVNVTDHSKFRD